MAGTPNRRAPIIDALREFGPMTSKEIADATEIPTAKVSSAIKRARHRFPGVYFRIVGWQQQTGRWSMDHPIYAAEPGKDVRRPRIDPRHRHAQADKRYRHKMGEAARVIKRYRNNRSATKPAELNPFVSLLAPKDRGIFGLAQAANVPKLKRAA